MSTSLKSLKIHKAHHDLKALKKQHEYFSNQLVLFDAGVPIHEAFSNREHIVLMVKMVDDQISKYESHMSHNKRERQDEDEVYT